MTLFPKPSQYSEENRDASLSASGLRQLDLEAGAQNRYVPYYYSGNWFISVLPFKLSLLPSLHCICTGRTRQTVRKLAIPLTSMISWCGELVTPFFEYFLCKLFGKSE